MDYRNKRILFTAFSVSPGSEELSLYDYLKGQGANDISALYWGGDVIADQIPAGVTRISIDSATSITPELISDYDVVFRHPSTSPDLLKGVNVTSLTQEFFDKCPAPIIGVTGTKGKGTTSTLIAKILEVSGKKVHLLGNIGKPSLDALPNILADDIVVHELSSFQLWDLKTSPHVAVILMIEPDHQDVHPGMEDYVSAKANIANHQTAEDFLFYNPVNELSAKAAQGGSAVKQKYMTQENAFVQDGKIFLRDQEIISVDEVGLLGKHNLENICAALAASSKFVDDVSAMSQAIREFKGLDNRLEFVKELDGVKYFNDSFSSAPVATKAAIQAFGEPIILILGGYDKQTDFTPLAGLIAEHKIKHVLLIGQIKQHIAEALTSKGYSDFELIDGTMEEIVARARNIASQGDIVLLSPGAASFDMFKDFKDRGRQFRAAVEGL
jgi:UDP-N-acetylmuramoylalanine--D-glutamate ligase